MVIAAICPFVLRTFDPDQLSSSLLPRIPTPRAALAGCPEYSSCWSQLMQQELTRISHASDARARSSGRFIGDVVT